MNQPPLNPDALRRAADAVSELYADGHCPKAEDAAEVAVSAYLAAALPEVTQSEELSILIGDVKTAIDHEHIDPREFIDLNDVLWALEAQAKPEVTSVEELDQLPVGAVVYASNHIGPAEKFAVGWMGCGNNAAWSSALLARDGLPARVLYRPSEHP